jgi:hypothetical protein
MTSPGSRTVKVERRARVALSKPTNWAQGHQRSFPPDPGAASPEPRAVSQPAAIDSDPVGSQQARLAFFAVAQRDKRDFVIGSNNFRSPI